MTRFRRLLPALVVPAVVVGLSSAGARSTQATPPSIGLIVGQVVDAASVKPVAGAIVTLTFSAAPRPPLPPGTTLSPAEQAALQAASAPRRLMTDGSGAFVFHSLQKGTYRLSVDATGYLSGGFGQTRANGPTRPIDVDQGERRTGIALKVWPYASVSGAVFDEAGDPAVEVLVRLMRVTTASGPRRFSPLQSIQTDDRGMYRFSQLSPGDYLVALPQTTTSMPSSTIESFTTLKGDAQANVSRDLQSSGAPGPYQNGIRSGDQQILVSGGANRLIAPPSPGDNGKTFAYQTMYYPSASTATDATPISVSVGQDRSGIDLQLRPAQTVRVSGVVNGPDGPTANIGVKLLPGSADSLTSENGFETATTATDGFGAFVFPAVPSGAYTLRVLKVPRPAPPAPPPPPPPGGRGLAISPLPPPVPVDPVLWAELPVAVSDTDVTGLTVSIRPGARITGHVVFEGSATPPAPDALQRMNVSVSSADGRPNNVNGIGRVTANAQFTTPGYPPGRYFISIGGASGWYFKSATFGGRNLDDEPLTVEGSDISGVTLTFSDRTTQISGTVHDPSVARDLGATVLFFPSNYAAELERGAIGRRLRSSSVAGGGMFLVSGLPAGDYFAVALNPDGLSDIRDKAFYDAAARVATRMTLGDGEKKTLDLTVSTIR